MKIYLHDLKDIRNDRTIILKSEEDKMMEQKKQELVRRIQEIGESLIKNAESIVGSEQYLRNIYISVNLNDQEEPAIEVTKEFLPERYTDRSTKFGPNDL